MIDPTVSLSTLGCKLNQYESDSIATTLRERGYEIVDGDAGIRIINSCTVTNRADRKSRNALFRARRRGDGLVIITGCFATGHMEELRREGVADIVVDNERKRYIPDIIDAYRNGEIIIPDSLEPDTFGFSTPDGRFHTRTNIKIQDGCDSFCSYCIIPHVRGAADSRPISAVLSDIRTAVARGSHEIVLTGVNMSRYKDESVHFSALIEAVLALPGDFRLRISSLEPDGLDGAFFSLFTHPKMCPHLHLCIQSGSDKTLRAMNRGYSVADFRTIARHLRDSDENFNLTTDMIIGFPGETEDDLAANIDIAREFRFGHIHTFPFSTREGTAASRMPKQIPAQMKADWARRVREISGELTREYRSRLTGSRETVLVEKVFVREGTRYASGLGEHYVPVEFPVPAGAVDSVRQNTVHRVEVVTAGSTESGVSGADSPLTGRIL